DTGHELVGDFRVKIAAWTVGVGHDLLLGLGAAWIGGLPCRRGSDGKEWWQNPTSGRAAGAALSRGECLAAATPGARTRHKGKTAKSGPMLKEEQTQHRPRATRARISGGGAY